MTQRSNLVRYLPAHRKYEIETNSKVVVFSMKAISSVIPLSFFFFSFFFGGGGGGQLTFHYVHLLHSP